MTDVQPPPGQGQTAAVAPDGTTVQPAEAGGPAYATADLALAAAPPPKRFNWKRTLMLAGVIAFIALCGIAVLIVIGWRGGLVAFSVGLVGAVLPVPLLVFCFLWLDRYEPEPVKYLLFCFAWGACVSTAASIAVNTGSGLLFSAVGLPDALVAVIVAPFIEELTKALGPMILLWRRRHAISGMIDAIVYCGLSAIGFAMVENILYIGNQGYAQGAETAGPLAGAQYAVLIFFARIVMSGFAHPLFTSMTGIGLGIAARAASKGVRIAAPIAGLLVAMMLHGTWNLMATISQQFAYALLYGYFAVMVPIFLGMVGFTLWLRGSEGRLVERELAAYATAGWLTPPEVSALGTLGRRLSARRWAKRVAGEAGAKAMRAFQFEATKLALLRDGMRRGLGMRPPELQHTLDEERRLLDALAAYRRVFIGRDPQAPRAMWDGQRYHVAFPDGMTRVFAAPEQPVVPVPVPLRPPPPSIPVSPPFPYPYR
jgi:RsiW-degrading membrane proteinase PrsW (M82 family)